MKKTVFLFLASLAAFILSPSPILPAKQKLSVDELKKAVSPVETKKGVLFTFEHASADAIAVAGTFNNWDAGKNLLKKNKNGLWFTVVPLKKGKIEYKFVIDGKDWKEDPANKNKTADAYGGGNKSLFDVKTGVDLGGLSLKGNKASFKVYHPEAQTVSLAGSFNEWNVNANPMKKDADGFWTIELELIPGKYQYKYVVNASQWLSDPMNPDSSDDGFGGINSVFEIP